MNNEPQIETERTIRMHDGRPGLRAVLAVETHEPPTPPKALDAIHDPQSTIHAPKALHAIHDPQSTIHGPKALDAIHDQRSTINAPVLDFIASNASLDRYHEVIDPAGWRLEAYRRNPVFQNAHNYGDVIFTLGKALVAEVRSDAGGAPYLFQRIEFATAVNPMARIAYGLYHGGFLRAVSVGFIPVRWENGSPDSPFRRKYLEQELLELSAVAIPANPDALALGLKAGAVRKDDVSEAHDLIRLFLSRSASMPLNSQPSTLNLCDFARSLHRVMRA